MTKVYCNECDWRGLESETGEVIDSETSEFWGQHATIRRTVMSCPDCGSTEIVDDFEEMYDDE